MVYYGYSLGDSFEWGLRYTDIEYEVEGLSVDGSSFGLYAGSFFE